MQYQLTKQASRGYTLSFNPKRVGFIIIAIALLLFALQAYDDWRLSRFRVKGIEDRDFADPNKYLEIPKELPKW
ncbi:MAG: hypothetical protein HWQ38_00010 [Nostoc sp. NMS7]|uniref:hypothetical protein n=1 Tax=Nostoc sp. NMS7 TaxID=2815391 RepID=UPI0025E540EA|nr:hypothetical protein [Nostoc sp. NMS7]MBN3944949.1 hypothetical protein [Nostoc sp. NMS7]